MIYNNNWPGHAVVLSFLPSSPQLRRLFPSFLHPDPLENMAASDDEKDVTQEHEEMLSDYKRSSALESNENLPSPVSAIPSKPKAKLSAAMIIPVWMIISASVILYNNYVFNTIKFKFPVFIVTWHLIFAVSFPTRSPDCALIFLRRPLGRVCCSAPLNWLTAQRT